MEKQSRPPLARPAAADPQTRRIHAAEAQVPLVRTVNPPIQRASTVLMPSAAALYDGSGATYGRAGLATQKALGEALSELDGAAGTRLYPSGLAAITGALLALLESGDDILVCEHAYRPTRAFCERVLKRYGVTARFYPQTASPAEIMALARPRTRLIYLESPGSLSFQMQDAPAIAAAARAAGVRTLMDNTWAAGVAFHPLAHGIDLAVQSLSKYAGGHSDLIMGAVQARDAATLGLIDQGFEDLGWSVSPEDAYLMLRSVRTLSVRLERHHANALKVAEWLSDQPQVSRVLYPPLPSDPGHALWRRDYVGASGLFGVVLRPGPVEAAAAMLDALAIFGLGFSWGGHESLALHCDPQRVWGTAIPAYEGPLLRLHIGMEAPGDLIADLTVGLEAYDRARGV